MPLCLIFMYQIYAVLHILKSALLTSVRPLMSLQMRWFGVDLFAPAELALVNPPLAPVQHDIETAATFFCWTPPRLDNLLSGKFLPTTTAAATTTADFKIFHPFQLEAVPGAGG